MTHSLAILYCINLNLPKIVTGPGRYVTRSGEVVTVDHLGHYNNFMAYGSYGDGLAESWMTSGRVLPHYESKNDIVKAA